MYASLATERISDGASDWVCIMMSADRCGLGKGPCSAQNRSARPVETNQIVPTGRDRDAVRRPAVTPAELHVDCTVGVLLCRKAVHRIAVEAVRLEIALRVVDADRPEPVDGDVARRETMNGRAVVPLRRDADVERIRFGIPAPPIRGADQMTHGVYLAAIAEHATRVRKRGRQRQQRFAHFALTDVIPQRNLEATGIPLVDAKTRLQLVHLREIGRIPGIDENA